MSFEKLQVKIGITFKDQDLLRTAFMHRSYLNEHREEQSESNERLEFLGDAVLELAVTRHLYDLYPEENEGNLTTLRSALVKGKNLAEISKTIDLGDCLFLSNGEEKSGGREKNYILANTLEALIGAIYLDQGYDIAQKFIKEQVLTRLDEIIEKGLHVDAKTSFQETAQELLSITPRYEILNETGPDHKKTFTVGVYLGEEQAGEGTGSSKQKAENEAAKDALKNKSWN